MSAWPFMWDHIAEPGVRSRLLRCLLRLFLLWGCASWTQVEVSNHYARFFCHHQSFLTSPCLGTLSSLPVKRKLPRLFAMLFLARMDQATLWNANVRMQTAGSAKIGTPRIQYVGHTRQIAPHAECMTLNLGSHMDALHAAVSEADHMCKLGNLPVQQPDVCGKHLSPVLAEPRSLEADSVVTIRAIDDPSGQRLFRRKHTSRCNPQLPQTDDLGLEVLDKLGRFLVCIVSSETGAGKSLRVPASLLGDPLKEHPHGDHGVALMIGLEEAQKTMYQKILEEHPRTLLGWAFETENLVTTVGHSMVPSLFLYSCESFLSHLRCWSRWEECQAHEL